MLRVTLTYILSLLLPMGLNFLWIWFRNRRSIALDLNLTKTALPGSWVFLIGIGLVLAFALVATMILHTYSGTDTVYIPPHLVNGLVVPGHLVPRDGLTAVEESSPPPQPERAHPILPW